MFWNKTSKVSTSPETNSAAGVHMGCVQPAADPTENPMTLVSRYHPLLVALHSILAVLIIAALALGAVVMAKLPEATP